MRSPSLTAGLVLVLLLLPCTALAGERPTLPELTDKQEARVLDGKLVLVPKPVQKEGHAAVTGIIEIEAEPQEIWAVLLSNEHIIDSSKAVREVVTYHDVTDSSGARDLRLAFLMKVGWSEIRFHSHRTVRQAEGYMTWQLDSDKTNDIESSKGSYSTWPGSAAGRTRFLYEARIETGKKIPEWLEEELTESSLKKFLVYVKKIAER